jgi:hypothetical protein
VRDSTAWDQDDEGPFLRWRSESRRDLSRNQILLLCTEEVVSLLGVADEGRTSRVKVRRLRRAGACDQDCICCSSGESSIIRDADE